MNEHEKLLAYMFDDAMKLRDAGDLVAARRLLGSLVEQLTPEDNRMLSYAHAQLGLISKQLGDHAAQEVHYRVAVENTPWYDVASLALFHTLYDQKRRTEAFTEMVRFLRARPSKRYAEMVMGMFDETDPGVLRANFDTEQKRLLAEARSLVTRHRKN